ncbi:autotransporter protein [Yersinia aldovae]|uniref:autotransporter outer membrane beta-barrel domain-containing protein n=1 Tax=Yersinia aldovae TaxID=29483 RepID=UPI0005E9BE20|nr:autotransporter outer membrane beta-barrel domain-containing protein [Yersinia aldovae]CNI21599.1 autotransporter protein [Yersinia aldovae]
MKSQFNLQKNLLFIPCFLFFFQSYSVSAIDYNNEQINGNLSLVNGDSVSDSNVNNGGYLNLGNGSTSSQITIYGGGVVGVQNGALSDGTTVYDEGVFSVVGQSKNTTLNGNMKVSGIADTTVINNKGVQTIFGLGLATNTIINNGGTQVVSGVSDMTKIEVGGVQNIGKGGTGKNTIINGGVQNVHSGGNVESTIINQNGTQVVNVNASAENTIINSGEQLISGYATDTTAYGTSKQVVTSGGVSDSSVLFDESKILIDDGSTAKNTTLNNSSQLYASAGSIIQGKTSIKDNGTVTMVIESGKISSAETVTVESKGSSLIIYSADNSIGNQAIINELSNSGVIRFESNSNNAVSTLIVNGNYHGDAGTVVFNTELNGDSSRTDKMIINGDTSGSTLVSINNLGGTGEQTIDGIELIEVKGDSNGTFSKASRIVAGMYDYDIVKNGNNWYLNSYIPTTTPTPTPTPTPDDHVVRPESGSYIANLAAANTLFNTRLQDRLGGTQYTDALTGERKVTSMWMRNEGGHNRSRDANGQLSTQANRYVLQLGGDIAQWSNNDLNRFHLGVMAGYANSKSRTESRLSGYSARSSVDGYSTGVYGTWYANDTAKSGWYVDSWMLYSWFNNTVNGQDLVTEEYKSHGVTASIESGYTFKIGENVAKNTQYFIQPKAQVTWMGVKADDHKEANGTNVSGEGNGNIQTRLGIKVFMSGYAEQDKGKDRVFQPFVETNWVHNTRDFGTNMDGITVKQDGAINIAELKVGIEGQINKKINLWGNVSQQVGNKGYSDTAAMLGIKYNF